MNKVLLNSVLSKYDTLKIEKALFRRYLESHEIDFQESPILFDYFQDQLRDDELQERLSRMNLDSFGNLEHIMELLIPKEDRKLNGAFFTPDYIVDFIIKETSPSIDGQVLDPSCGCGAFLLGTIRYFEALGRGIRDVVRENLYGSDILDYNVRRAKILITIYALEKGVLLEEDDFNLFTQDSLRADWNMEFDAVVGNPPYVKFQDLSDLNRSFLKSEWESIDKGTYNVYFAFFELAFNLLKADGKLGYITPNNYFTSLAGISLRNFFSSRRSIYKIIDFNHHKVFDAQTYTCLTFLNRKTNDYIEFDKLYDSNPKEMLERSEYSKVHYFDLDDKKWRLLRESEQQNIRNIETIGIPLNQLFVINVGIATLKDSLYFIDGSSKKGKFYIKKHESQDYKIEEGLVKAVYKISDFKNQSDCANNDRKIIFPYRIVNGKSVVMQEADLKSNFPKGYKYLISIKNELEKRGKDKPTPFYLYGRSQGLNKFGIRLLTPTFSQRPKFLLVREVNSLYCNGYGLHYKEDFNNGISLFDGRPIQRKENIDVLQKILNSEIMHYYVYHTSVSIQGGYPCYQKNFIERFTIPDLNQEEVNRLKIMQASEIDEFLEDKYQVKLGLPNLA